jgi:hypothetical protein
MTLEETTCNAIRESLQRDDYGKSVIAHLGECEQCLDVAVNTLLAGREDVFVAPGFVSQVLVKVSSSTTPAAPFRPRRALWPAIVAVCALIGAVFLPHLSAFAQSWWGAAVLAAGGMETSLIIVWVLGWNRSALVFHQADAAG